MILRGVGEFRGLMEKHTQEGKQYFLIAFEDVETFDQVRFYSPRDAKYKTDRGALQKGKSYQLALNYHLNTYDNKWQVDLMDIGDEVLSKPKQ